MRIALGTAQFGMNYGISNSAGKVKPEDVEDILKLAHLLGVDTIDTAPSYGESEKVLGKIGVKEFKIVTKVPRCNDNFCRSESWLSKTVDASLTNLNRDTIDILLFHSPSDLFSANGKRLLGQVEDLKERGYVTKIGYSLYSPQELDRLTKLHWPDCVQVPVNLIDRRFPSSGWLKTLHERGVEVHARSAFLQGVLLQGENERPKFFRKWSDIFEDYDQWVAYKRLTRVQATIGYLQSLSNIDRIVVGVLSKEQLAEIAKAADQSVSEAPDELTSNDEKLINPSNWPR